MKLSWQKLLFFSLFFLAFVSSFLYAETRYSYLVLLVFTVVSWLGVKIFPLKQQVNKTLVLSILGFLIFGFTSLLFSISLPLSLAVYLKYLTLFLVFITFLVLDLTTVEKKLILDIFIFSGLFFVLFVIFLFVNQDFSKLMPGINLIFPTYGHNHLGTFLLLIAPVASYLFFKERKNFYLFATIVFYLFLLFSFGRIILLISIAQLLTLLLVYFKDLSFKNSVLPKLLLVVIFLISVAFLVVQLTAKNCNLVGNSFLEQKICKIDFGTNIRVYYWQQAWRSLIDRPSFGSGFGTFELRSLKYRQIPDLWSKYVHNDFLQVLVEGGVFTFLAFIIFIFTLLKNIVRSSKYHYLLILGLVSFVIDIFFDYNFQLFSLALTFLIISGLFMVEPANTLTSLKVNKILNFFTFIILIFSVIHIITSMLIALNKEKLVAKFFPYFSDQAQVFINSDNLEPQEKIAVINYYLPNFANDLITNYPSDKVDELKYQLWSLDPWRAINDSQLINKYYLSNDLANLDKTVGFVVDLLEKSKREIAFKNESLDFYDKVIFSKAAIKLAEHELTQGNVEKAAKHLVAAYHFEPWTIGRDFLFLGYLFREDCSPEQRLSFLKITQDIPLEYWGENRDDLARLYLFVFTDLNSQPVDLKQKQFFLEKMIEAADWSINLLEEFFAEQDFNQLVYEENKEIITLFQLTYSFLKNNYQGNQYFNDNFYQSRVVGLEKLYQKHLDLLLRDGTAEEVSAFFEFVDQNSFGLYWLPAQKGYFMAQKFGLNGVKEIFENCLVLNKNNQECKFGLDSLMSGDFYFQRYDEVREKINNL